MIEVEKNDVDISKLFNWGRKYEITDSEGAVQATVYMKLMGDSDVNIARVHAIRKSADLRRKLQDSKSDENVIFIKPMDAIAMEDLLNLITVFSMREITAEAYKNTSVKRPVQPKSNASLAKMEKYQKELDDYPALYRAAVEKQMKSEVDKLKAQLKTESHEALYKRYVSTLIDELCEQEALNSYKNIEVYLGCYKDENYKERFFSSFEEYDNIPTEMKNEFRNAYDKLDIRVDELKKLRAATQ